jgi:hypothetical protein
LLLQFLELGCHMNFFPFTSGHGEKQQEIQLLMTSRCVVLQHSAQTPVSEPLSTTIWNSWDLLLTLKLQHIAR